MHEWILLAACTRLLPRCHTVQEINETTHPLPMEAQELPSARQLTEGSEEEKLLPELNHLA